MPNGIAAQPRRADQGKDTKLAKDWTTWTPICEKTSWIPSPTPPVAAKYVPPLQNPKLPGQQEEIRNSPTGLVVIKTIRAVMDSTCSTRPETCTASKAPRLRDAFIKADSDIVFDRSKHDRAEERRAEAHRVILI